MDGARQERETMARQYQDYIDQLTSQTQQLQAQINTLIDERERQGETRRELETTVERLKADAQTHGKRRRDDTSRRQSR